MPTLCFFTPHNIQCHFYTAMVQYCSLIFKSVKPQAKGAAGSRERFYRVLMVFEQIMENPASVITVHPIINKNKLC